MGAPTSGVVIWFTGIPGSGKSHHARLLRDHLDRLGIPCVLLDGDAVRRQVVPRHGYDSASREAFYTTLSNLAALLADQGRVVLVSATAHRRAFREHARAAAPRFLEVHVATPLALSVAQDAAREAQVYGKAPGQIPGVDIDYEEPISPDIVITPGDRHTSVERVLGKLSASFPEPAAPGVVALSRSTYISIALRPDAHAAAQRSLCDRLGLVARPELHLTLAYLGDIEVPRLLRLHADLMQAGLDWGALRLRAVGLGAAVGEEAPRPCACLDEALPAADLPRVAWWAVEPAEALLRLQEAVVEVVRRAGLPADRIEGHYWPHITLGSAGPAGRDWSRWDVHAFAKTACLEPAVAAEALIPGVAHITNTSTHPESLLPIHHFGHFGGGGEER
ncbi:MAG TPA: adenylyl-sulfate kinase [Candidatus Nanopelagicales bacterium]|nr:adenylyl-sulfate kinase [Candidatus Nanopelagicales bacterium]